MFSSDSNNLRHPMFTACLHRRAEMVRARHDIGDEFSLSGIWIRRSQDADNGGSTRIDRIEADLLSNHTWVTLQDRRSESISQNRRAFGGWAIIRNGEETPSDGVKPHHIEVVSADDAGLDDSRFAESDHRESNRRELGDLRKRLRRFAQILDSGTEKVALSLPMPPALCHIYIYIWASSRFANGRSSTPLTTLKIAALAPVPRASVSTTVIESPFAITANEMLL
jgi:hypothetical protein